MTLHEDRTSTFVPGVNASFRAWCSARRFTPATALVERPFKNPAGLVCVIGLGLLLSAFRLPGNPPSDGLQIWLKGDAGVVENEGTVTSWTDQSANGIVFSPPAAGPVAAAEAELNSATVIRFSGSEQLNGSLPGATWSEGTVFAVMRYNIADSGNEYLYTFGTTGTGEQWTASRRTNQRAYHYDGGTTHLSANGAIPGNRFLIMSQTFGRKGSRSHEWRVDERLVLESEAGGDYSVDAAELVIGNWSSGDYRFPGDLAEMLVYDRPLDVNERVRVEEYFMQRYGWAGYLATTPEDFSSWEVVQYDLGAQGAANWVISPDGDSIDQTVNADPSIFLSQATFSRGTVEGEIGAGSAPDFMGFVFGYQDRGRFYVFDWKKSGASWLDFGYAEAGMRLRAFHVDGDPNGGDFWSSADPEHVTVLRSNDVPWVDGVIYDYRLVFRPGQIEIEIHDGETLVESWSVADDRYAGGRFGYFINSLQDVHYGKLSFSLDDATPLRIVEFGNENGYFRLGWEGGVPPYTVESREDFSTAGWTVRGSALPARALLLPIAYDRRAFRVSDGSTPQ